MRRKEGQVKRVHIHHRWGSVEARIHEGPFGVLVVEQPSLELREEGRRRAN